MGRPKKRRRRVVRLGPEQRAVLERQRERFREKFGREPGPADPVFFDPTADEPRPLDPDAITATIAGAMEAAGIDPAKIHAYRRTGTAGPPAIRWNPCCATRRRRFAIGLVAAAGRRRRGATDLTTGRCLEVAKGPTLMLVSGPKGWS